MAQIHARSRRIVLFVEGDTEQTLPAFFHKWLDPQLPPLSKVGIQAVSFQGVSNYLDDLPRKLELYLTEGGANFVVGLVDLYGLPPTRVNLLNCLTIKDKVAKARAEILRLVPPAFRELFRQHFAVHEVEAWLLAYPDRWPPNVRSQITQRPPEEVNFNEPPARFLKRILRGSYRKTVYARNIFRCENPQTAINNCPFLKLLAQDLREIAKRLQ
jgi:hypothetical protein